MIRPIVPEDEPLMIRFHEHLSEQSVYLRYFHLMKLEERISHSRLAHICLIDYQRAIVLVAEREGEIIAVGRLNKSDNEQHGEFAIVVSDAFQHRGLGTELLRRLIEIGSAEGLRRITAIILPENRAMQVVSERAGFRLYYSVEDRVVKAELPIG